jgi:hypothetical protein
MLDSMGLTDFLFGQVQSLRLKSQSQLMLFSFDINNKNYNNYETQLHQTYAVGAVMHHQPQHVSPLL